MTRLDVRSISRTYGAVKALQGVSLCFKAGETHALMGENGAGKSTLIRALAGLERLDGGAIHLDDTPLPSGNPQAMLGAGLRFIHQELHPVRGLSVAENMHLDHRYPTRLGLVDWTALNRRARAALDRLLLDAIDPAAPMAALGAGDQMLVRIAATLLASAHGRAPWLYVMDEPTAALTEAEAERLFAVIAQLVGDGAGVIYVSHRLPEVLRLSNTVSVLRDGQCVLSAPRAEVGHDRLIEAMTGRDLSGLFPARETALDTGQPAILSVDSLSAEGLTSASLSLRPGEILGLGGLSGSGRAALLRALLGAVPRHGGSAELAGQPLAHKPSEVWAQGLAYIPRERRSEGLMMRRSVRENIALPHLGALTRARYFLNRARQKVLAEGYGAQVRLKVTNDLQPCNELSGGNQQKVLFARALAGAPKVLMLDEPTRGVDIGARYDLYRIIRPLSEAGTAVLLASSA
ncbi:MAG: sugar ABC transporter ATP-binding protein, partial [Devosiaceae bacterium]|nr:sugar ABC transporter ATP-binding protein [Devosiaceae bacterium MH13]